jgi:glycosyltransferase involved in cell wall biosynthesis
MHVRVVDIDLAEGLQDVVTGLAETTVAHVLIRYAGLPLCRFEIPVRDGSIAAADLWTYTTRQQDQWGREAAFAMTFGLLAGNSFGRRLPGATSEEPCSVVVCTRDRPEDLRRCLSSLEPLIGPGVEVLVVDNDPSDDQSESIASEFPVRYYRQTRRGVNWARARGVALAQHEIVLFVDDDVVVDRRWIERMRAAFSYAGVGAVTGAVEPFELSTRGQHMHEQFSSFYRGFNLLVYNILSASPASAGQVGAGANMGVRRSVAVRHHIFNTELDGGTAAKSGGDVYALYLILRYGYTIRYEPTVLAWHRHRTTYSELKKMLYGYSVGGYCVLLSAAFRQRDPDAVLIAIKWFFNYHIREVCRCLIRRPGARPLGLILTEDP